MISLRAWNEKVVAIYGAGPVGLSVSSALSRAGAHVYIWDDNARVREKLAEAQITCTAPDDWPWDELTAIVPGHHKRANFTLSDPLLDKAASKQIPVRSDVDIFAEAVNSLPANQRPKVIGITGTYGKSASASLITHILKEAGREVFCAGGAGKPILSLPLGGAESFYVLGVPLRTLAFTTKLQCNAAVLLNVAEPDIRFFGKADQTVKTAMKILRNQAAEDAMIIGADDQVSQKICTAITANMPSKGFRSETLIPCSGEATLGLGVFSLDGHVFDARHDKTVALGDLKQASAVLGAHMNHNAASAYAVCLHLGLASGLITRAVQCWQGLAGRMQCLGEAGRVMFIDDTKADRLRPTLAAITAMRTVFWVGGGVDRRQDYKKLCQGRKHIEKAFLYGAAGVKIQDACEEAFASEIYLTPAAAVAAAMDAAAQRVEGACLVLFSPGCPATVSLGTTAELQAVFSQAIEHYRKEQAA